MCNSYPPFCKHPSTRAGKSVEQLVAESLTAYKMPGMYADA